MKHKHLIARMHEIVNHGTHSETKRQSFKALRDFIVPPHLDSAQRTNTCLLGHVSLVLDINYL